MTKKKSKSANEYKQELISYLKEKYINNDINRLWGEARHYYMSRCIEFGGGYSNVGSKILIRINSHSFRVSLEEIQ